MLKHVSPVLFAVCLWAVVSAATADAATIEAASCSQQDVQAAVDAASDGDTVLVPAGTATWTSPAGNAPSVRISKKAITVQGAGMDKTVITDATGARGRQVPFLIVTAEGKPFRITGFAFEEHLTANDWSGMIVLGGDGKNFRIDHCKFANNRIKGISVGGACYGVIDHCVFTGRQQSIYVSHSTLGGGSYGDGSWSSPLTLGTGKAVYVEDNTFEYAKPTTGTGAIDSASGGRYVFRHNTVINTTVGTHGTETSGRLRSVRSYEIYGNTFQNKGKRWVLPRAIFLRGGTGVVFDNTFTGYRVAVGVNNYRDVNTFKFWGMADGTSPYDRNDGVTYDSGSHTGDKGQGVLACAGKEWDADQWVGYSLRNTTTGKSGIIRANTQDTISVVPAIYGDSLTWNTGDAFTILRAYPCLDQIGRSTGKRLSGHDPPLPKEWPEQALEPLYAWNNTLDGADVGIGSDSLHVLKNRDFYNGTPRPGYKPYTYPHPLTQQFPPPPKSDFEAPAVPQGLTARAVSDTQVDLSWEAPADGEGVMGYSVWRNGKRLTTITDPGCTRYSMLGLEPQLAEYTFAISAFDAAGNESKPSAPAGPVAGKAVEDAARDIP